MNVKGRYCHLLESVKISSGIADYTDLLVLCIPKFSKRISGHATVAGEDVQVAVISEEQLAPVVIRSRFINLQYNSEIRNSTTESMRYKQKQSACM